MQRQTRFRLRIAAWIGFALLAVPALPQNQSVDVKAIVTVRYANPMVRLSFRVESQKLLGTRWACTLGNQDQMDRGWGMTEESLATGEEVTIRGVLTGDGSRFSVQAMDKPARQVHLQRRDPKAPAIECALQPAAANQH